MKRFLLFSLVLALIPAFVFADILPAGPLQPTLDSQPGLPRQALRNPPSYTFTKLPTSIIINYYDYMIGAYNGMPLRVIPQSAGGGYFMTYHGRRQATSTRRQFYTYIDVNGNIVNNNEITSVQNHEGFGTLAVDPVDGKPLYTWHSNADADANNEVEFTSDAFIAGIAGLFNDISLAADAPTTIVTPGGITTTDNEFIWPTMVIGPSPVANKRRVYVAMRNYVTHSNAIPVENAYIAYADFNGTDIENGVPMVWNHVTIPDQDTWNADTTTSRRPSGTITADNAGNLYFAGHHNTWDAESNGISEPDLDVWICPNYGQGTWTYFNGDGNIPTWNPNTAPTDTTGYYTDPDNGDIPYGDGSIYFAQSNNGHYNVIIDSDGNIHVPGVWALNSYNGYYYPALQFVKEYVFNVNSHTYTIRDVYPQKPAEDTFNATFTPWDVEAPWGVEDGWSGDATNGYYPNIITGWPFPHWDSAAHTDAMMFHYNGVRVSQPNDQGMMVCVWQDSERARMYNYYSDTDYSAFANTPEILISISPNSGGYWSEPINLNNVETPQMAGLKPMYVYPADSVIFTGVQGESNVGKIGLMFYNDYTWGSNVNAPAYHPTADGGETMFMELQIVFPQLASDDPVLAPAPKILRQNFPNPFNPETTISFDLPRSAAANLSVYNTKGQLVKTLADGVLEFGRQSFVWNGTDSFGNPVASGLYFYRLTTDGQSESRKMMLLK